MKPLLFLTFRQAKNSIIRSLTSVKRLIGILFIVLYYYSFIFRRFTSGGVPSRFASPMQLDFPATDIIGAVVFGGSLVVMMLFWLSLGVQRGGFRSADVDMLFPTPVNPRIVLFFRMIRENIAALLLPLLLVIFGGPALGGQIRMLFRHVPNPDALSQAGRWLLLAWLLTQVFWISASYAYALWAYRFDEKTWQRRIAGWSSFGALAIIVGYVSLLFRQPDASAHTFMDAALHGPLRLIFPMASGAANIAMAPVTGDTILAILAGIGLLAAAGALIWAAMLNVAYMYEHAALTTSSIETARSAIRAGDLMASFKIRAAEGKVKVRHIRWVDRLRWQGPMAVVWKELILNIRTSLPSMTVFLVLGLVYSLLPILAARAERPGNDDFRMLVGIALGTSPFIVWMTAWTMSRSGFVEVLKRVDADKALPFSLSQFLFAQSTIRNLEACLIGWLIVVGVIIARPDMAHPALSVGVLLLPFCFVVSSVVLFFMLLFPDIEDMSQRTFREMLTLIVMAIAMVPGIIFGGFVLFNFESMYWLAALVMSLANTAVAFLVMMMCAELYAVHNPSE